MNKETVYKKPTSCDECVAIERVTTDIVKCGCLRTLSAKRDDLKEKLNMWNLCPLNWK